MKCRNCGIPNPFPTCWLSEVTVEYETGEVFCTREPKVVYCQKCFERAKGLLTGVVMEAASRGNLKYV